MHSMLPRKFRRLLPVRNQPLFPLPIKRGRVFRWPTIGNPIRISVRGIPTGATGESDNHLYPNALGQLHRLAEGLIVALRYGLVRRDGIPMTAQHGNLNVVICKFLLPGAHLCRISEQVVEWAMLVVRISAGADLCCFHAHAFIFLN